MKNIKLVAFALASSIALSSCNESKKEEHKIDNENKTEQSDKTVLNHDKLSDIEGVYINGKKGEGYYDELNVSRNDDGLYLIKISSGTAKKGCLFEGKGKLENNKISLPLSEYQKEMKSKMIIEFTDKGASIYTDNSENNYDLMYFCGGGGSLAGDYVKE